MGPKSQNKDKKATKSVKVLPVYSREEPSPARPSFKFCTTEKILYKASRVSY